MNIFLMGLALGLSYVAPIGMQNMFVINSALTQQRSRAFVTAAIVVFFDISLAFTCYLGIGKLLQEAEVLQRYILLAGSIVVIIIGISLIKNANSEPETQDVDVPVRKVALSAFVVTWCNVQAIIDGTMLLGATRASLGASDGGIFLSAVMCASALWFFGITFFIGLFGSRFTPGIITWINRVCGVVIIAYGIKLLVQFFQLVFNII